MQQFTSEFGPTAEDYQAVVLWARANGFSVGNAPANRLLVPVIGTVSQVNAALHITMKSYQDPIQKRTFYAPDREPSVNLNVPLSYVAGLDNYSIPHSATAVGNISVASGSGPYGTFIGSDMRAAYYGGTSLIGSGQSVGVASFYGTDLSDLDAYFSNVGQTNNVPIYLYSEDGTSTSCVYDTAGDYCDDTEQTLDMIQVLSMAPGLKRLVLYIGSTGAAILNEMATPYNGSLDYSLVSSWAWLPAQGPTANDRFFEEFAAQGQSFFVAAGDHGACSTGLWDGGYVYPADDPNVISVGGTDLETTGAGGSWSDETTWEGTGGGISPLPAEFPIPSWQASTAKNCSACSQSYRNGPDVAGNANYTFYVCADQGNNPNFAGQECGPNQYSCTSGNCPTYGGTSFSAPMWAGYIALVNQQAAAYGEGTVGFIDPALYTSIGAGSGYGNEFHDITNGCNNADCAIAGYDLVTGWGSPNRQALIDILAPPPACTASPQCFGSGNFGTAAVSLSCSSATQISTSATLCGLYGNGGCGTNNGPSGLLTSSTAGYQGEVYSGAYCILNWCWGGNCYQQQMQP